MSADLADLELDFQALATLIKELESDVKLFQTGKKRALDIKPRLRLGSVKIKSLRSSWNALKSSMPENDGHVMAWKGKIDQAEATLARFQEIVNGAPAGAGRGGAQAKGRPGAGGRGAADAASSSPASSSGTGLSALEIERLSDPQKYELARNTVDESEKSLNTSLRLVNDSIAVGGQAAQALNAQTAQMKEISAQLDAIEDEIGQAKKTLRAIFQRLGSDKLFVVLLLLCVAAIIAVIAISIYKQQ